jgi:(2Fe-2S) ferredoxin
MTLLDDAFYQKHIFFCTNQKDNNKPCCFDKNAKALFEYAKRKSVELQLPQKKIRVSQSGCLGRCELGPCVVVYPEGQWHQIKDEMEVDDLLKSLNCD